MGKTNEQLGDIESMRTEILDALQGGIEFFATKKPNVRYNQNILMELLDKILSKAINMHNPTGYAYIVGKNWAIEQLRLVEKQERIKQREATESREEIDAIIARVRIEIAAQEISAITTRLINDNIITATQVHQLRYLAISLNSGYDAADAAFPDVKTNARHQWRKRARTLLLKQPITENLRNLLEDLTVTSIK